MTLALSSLRGSSHCWVRASGAGLDPGRPPELGWLHTLLSTGSYTPQGRGTERCVWESAAYGQNVETARPSGNQSDAFCLYRVQRGLQQAGADRTFLNSSCCPHNTLPTWRNTHSIHKEPVLVSSVRNAVAIKSFPQNIYSLLSIKMVFFNQDCQYDILQF